MKSEKRAIFRNWIPNKRHIIFGDHPIIMKAPEPSNIIWENYNVSKSSSKRRKYFLSLIVYLVYSAFFYFSFKLYSHHTEFNTMFS